MQCDAPTSQLITLNQVYVSGPSTATEDEIWVIRCEFGYIWPDGSSLNYINCSTSTWGSFPPACSRSLHCILYSDLPAALNKG